MKIKHTLVKPDGTIGPTHDFIGSPPKIAPSKGRWLPDNPPAFDPDTQKLKVAEPINPAALEIPYQIRPLGAAQIARNAAARDAAGDLQNMAATPFAKQFAAFTKDDLDAYIDANVTDVAGAKNYLKRLSRLLLPIIKRELL